MAPVFTCLAASATFVQVLVKSAYCFAVGVLCASAIDGAQPSRLVVQGRRRQRWSSLARRCRLVYLLISLVFNL